jgi:hypothetical protein
VFPVMRPVPTVPPSPTTRNAPVGLIVPDRPRAAIRPPETVMDRVLEAAQPGEITVVQVPSYLATPPSLPPRRDDPVSALGNDLFVDWNFRGASAPVADLPVFPIVPPIEPACPKANELPARNIKMARRGLAVAPRIPVLFFNGSLLRWASASSRY